MNDDHARKIAKLQAQNEALRKALERLLEDVKYNAEPDGLTLEALEAAGYTFEKVAPEWTYTVSLSYEDRIYSDDGIRTEEDAFNMIRDRFTSDVTELVLRGSYEGFMAAVDIDLFAVP